MQKEQKERGKTKGRGRLRHPVRAAWHATCVPRSKSLSFVTVHV